MTFVRRYLWILGWPVVVWVESAEVVAIFIEDALETVSNHDNGPDFYSAHEHQPAAAAGKDEKKHTVAMSEHAGTAFIAKLGEDKFTIVLANYDRGNIKYEPAFAQDRWRLQVAADAAHQAHVAAYFAYIIEFGYPDDEVTFKKVLACGEAIVLSPSATS